MKIHSKVGLAMVALALSCSMAFAQADAPPVAPPEQSSGQSGSQPMPPARSMNRGQFGRRWDDMRPGFRPDGFYGMRRMQRARRSFALLRLLNDPEIRQQAGITSEQAAALRKDFSDFRKARIRERADLEIKRIDLENLLRADQPDRAAIDSKLEEISASQLALEKSRVDFRLTLRSAISPEQREKIQQLTRDRFPRRGALRGGRQGFRRGEQSGPPRSPDSSENSPDGASPNI